MPMNIVFLDRQTLASTTELKPLDSINHWQNYDHTTTDQIVERAKDAEIIISNKLPLDADVIAQLPKLKLIAIPATGYNHIDLLACEQQNIVVCNIPDYASTTVPEHVLALIFALQRQLMPYHKSVAAGRWQQSGQFCYFDYPIRDLKGSTLGIVGAGVLGHAVIDLARSVGLKVVLAGRKGATDLKQGYIPFEQMLRESDIISLHCPLTEDTKHLLSTTEFSQMDKKPLIINTARGELIDSEALVHALKVGQIRGAGIDVCHPEPPPFDHPFMKILDRDDFILTPHVAWSSAEAMQFLADELIKNINAFIQGRPINTVN